MSGDNPFEVSPDGYGDRSGRDRGVVTAEVSTRTIELLNQTRPWVSLIGVVFWLITALYVIFALFAFVGVALAGQAAGAALVVAVVYGIVGLIYGYLAKSLTGYASRINRLNGSERVEDLEDAMEAQKNFWRLSGILLLVSIVLALVVIGLMFAGVAFLGNLGRF